MARGTVGAVIELPGHYTECVSATDYRPRPRSDPVGILLTTGAASSLRALFEYVLGGKLVCLGTSECAIGRVVDIEPVGFGKPFPQDLDNDFAFNLLLAPHVLESFADAAAQATYPEEAKLAPDQQANFLNQHIVAGDRAQGRLIADPSASRPDPWPDPDGKHGNLKSTGYVLPAVVYLFGCEKPEQYIPRDDRALRLAEEIAQDAAGIKRIPIPVLHCECEGSRPSMVWRALSTVLPRHGGSEGTRYAVLGAIPIVGDALCALLEDVMTVALLPVLLAAVAVGWVDAQRFDDCFTTGPDSGEIATGDVVVVTGRWAWDAGHSGWNEFHPVHTIQKIEIPSERDPARATEETKQALDAFHARVARLVGEAPPDFGRPRAPRTPRQLQAMSLQQRAIHVRQQEPQNQWSIHPLIDGCEPLPGPRDF